MKELSIEEKAKRYDELKVTAQELEEDGCFDKITLFDLFPELKEGEDEKIRKELLDFCKNRAENYPNDPKYKNISAWIAWLENIPYTIDREKREGFHLGYKAGLEKQGEQKPTDIRTTGYWNVQEVEQKPAWNEEDEKILDGIIEASIHHCYLNITDINWLKSLKDRYTWKPSEEDLIYLKRAAENYDFCDGERTALMNLYNDLKKL